MTERVTLRKFILYPIPRFYFSTCYWLISENTLCTVFLSCSVFPPCNVLFEGWGWVPADMQLPLFYRTSPLGAMSCCVSGLTAVRPPCWRDLCRHSGLWPLLPANSDVRCQMFNKLAWTLCTRLVSIWVLAPDLQQCHVEQKNLPADPCPNSSLITLS